MDGQRRVSEPLMKNQNFQARLPGTLLASWHVCIGDLLRHDCNCARRD